MPNQTHLIDARSLLWSAANTPTLLLRGQTGYFVGKQNRVQPFPLGVRIPNGNCIVIKLEHLLSSSPTGSLYDRVYPWLFLNAMRTGRISPRETHVIECSVGNAGAAFAFVARALGFRRYSVILPADIYPARIQQVRGLGAEVILSPPKVGPRGYISLLEEMLSEESARGLRNRHAIFRFYPISKIRRTPAAPFIALVDESVEALRSVGLPGRVDAFVAVVGAGNTVTLAGHHVKMLNSAAKVFAVEHAETPFVSCYFHGQQPDLDTTWSEPDFPATTIQGVPIHKLNLDLSVLDGVISLPLDERERGLEALNRVLGLHAGRPSGLSFAAALRLCEAMESGTVLCIVFDSDAKYRDVWVPLYTYSPLAELEPATVTCHA